MNEPTITIAEMSVEGNDGSAGNGDVAPPNGAAFTLAVTLDSTGNSDRAFLRVKVK